MTTVAAVLCVFLTWVPVAGDESQPSPSPRTTPSEILRAAFKAAQHGNYDEADGYIAKRYREPFWRGGMTPKAWWDELTRVRTLAKLEVTSEKINGRSAVVSFRCSFSDGSTLENELEAVEEEEQWNLTVHRTIS